VSFLKHLKTVVCFIETSHVANNVCIQQSIVYEQKVRRNSNLEGSKCIHWNIIEPYGNHHYCFNNSMRHKKYNTLLNATSWRQDVHIEKLMNKNESNITIKYSGWEVVGFNILLTLLSNFSYLVVLFRKD